MGKALVVVALRQVDPFATVDPLTGTVYAQPRGGLSTADECALEHALRMAESLDARCLACTVGPQEADEVLRTALAAGATEALRVAGEPASEGHTARLLTEAIRARYADPALLLCGDYSMDRGTGATPALLAARFGASQALGLVELTSHNGGLRAERRLDCGRRERLAIELPAVCSVEPSTVRLRRASLPGLLAAREAEIPVASPAESFVDTRIRRRARTAYRPRTRAIAAPAGAAPGQRVRALTGALTEHEPPRLVFPANAAAAASELLDYLEQRGYLP
ncbi:electron transfer flavoprotein beta subunit [Tamaricihabitans halophyticus]|uniref:Electron transfer flavoprotein beta subunit n=1 Tax=Tamaricihabitans halophyticus TaxID=1262583 RepID=A0A4V2SUH7_9PSEU|nr:mycofactocin-associated electron transfer flavoprotein beta subunit [Tamaricihabitans halophyticus]TCP54126.1 electron transfer flavoprotein beta subunit [Tamaricihabitans halophyticus]